MLKAIILDFDGVICESVELKTEAFRKLFAAYPQHVPQIADFHLQNGGMNRFAKFQFIYEHILKEPLSEAKSKELGERFSEYVYQAVISAPLVDGAREFLSDYHQKLMLFVASATPHQEMVSIMEAKKLSFYFRAVYGSPMAKPEIILSILKECGLDSGEVIFVGDSINDYQGAQKTNVKFIGRIHRGYPDHFQGLAVESIIEDLHGLRTWVRAQLGEGEHYTSK